MGKAIAIIPLATLGLIQSILKKDDGMVTEFVNLTAEICNEKIVKKQLLGTLSTEEMTWFHTILINM